MMHRSCRSIWSLSLSVLFVSLSASAANAQGNPLKLTPRPTTTAISEEDLKTRIYIFADDSMQGRQFGREGNKKGTEYIARELKRLGIEPAGENGGYFQELPAVQRKYTNKSRLSVNGKELRWINDWIAVPGNAAPREVENAQVVYGGTIGDTTTLISAEQAAGKLVILRPAQPGNQPTSQQAAQAIGAAMNRRFGGAAALATADLHNLTPGARAFINNPPGRLANPNAPAPAQRPSPTLRITQEAAEQLLGAPLANVQPGATGGTVTARLDFVETPVPQFARNVIGVIRGSDPALAGQYVAVGAHNDHVGFNATAMNHDSAKAFQNAELAARFVGDTVIRNLTPEERSRIVVNMDSLRRLRPARRDSIFNGADDDGSGSMAVLEIAEFYARATAKPRRSILFVWHTGEEAGLLGSRYFVDHPTVPLDSIVAQINIDMIGRGRSEDLPGGGDDYLGVVGSKRNSTELGEMVGRVNERLQRPLKFDYRFDEDVTKTLGASYNNIYGRSDHFNYARKGIPIAFFFTGLHMDYHRVTDEPQYLDYPHYTRITNYIRELVTEIANRDKRPVVDKPIT